MGSIPKKIGFNGRPFCRPGIRGLSRHTLELIRHLHELDGELEIFIYCYEEMHSTYKDLLPFATFRDQKISPKILWDLWVLPGQLRADGIEIFHSTNNLGVPPRWSGCQSFVTIHDAFTHRARLPWRGPRNWWASLNYRIELALIKRCAAIFTVSVAAGDEIDRELQLGGRSPVVAYNGTSLPQALPSQRAPFFLYVGGLEERKNIICLVEGIKLFNAEVVDPTPLIIVGKIGDAPAQVRSMILASPELFLLREGVSDAELSQLYADARALIFPSKEEGFGLPLAEAFSLGCPAVVSDIKVFHELAADAALFFSPDDPLALAAQLRRLLTSPELQKELVNKGLERAATFRWDAMAKKVYETYFEFSTSSG